MDVALHRAGVTFVAGPRRGHRQRRRQPQRHVGHVDPPGRPGSAARRAARRRPGCARSCARRSPWTTRRPCCATRRAPCPTTCPPVRSGAAATCSPRTTATCCIVSVGAMAQSCVEAAERLADQGISATVVDPRWVIPAPAGLVELARGPPAGRGRRGQRAGGRGGRCRRPAAARRRASTPRCCELGIPREFLDHAARGELLADIGLTAQALARQVVEAFARREPALEDAPRAHTGADQPRRADAAGPQPGRRRSPLSRRCHRTSPSCSTSVGVSPAAAATRARPGGRGGCAPPSVVTPWSSNHATSAAGGLGREALPLPGGAHHPGHARRSSRARTGPAWPGPSPPARCRPACERPS